MNPDKRALRELPAPQYSQEEREKIIQYFMDLKGDLIREFLSNQNLPKSGTKPELKELIEEYLDEGQIKYSDLVNLLDSVIPFGKQHIFLLNGPEAEIDKWRDSSYVKTLLDKNNVSQYLNARLPLILPEALSLSWIEYERARFINIYAVERRDHWERQDEYDERKQLEDVEIELRAYSHQVTRGVVIFGWDLVSNTATLQISQLASGSRYEEVEDRFADLVKQWLDLASFQKLDLRPVIGKLQKSEESGNGETRSHGIGYRSLGGRSMWVQSPSHHDSILGEEYINNALRIFRRKGIGHGGNFYWLPASLNPANGNPLEKEVHTVIVANKQRINFTTPNNKDDIEYVLSRVRALGK